MSKKPEVPKIPQMGGSFVVGKDGKVVRQEFTLHPGDPEHEDNLRAQPAPVETASKDA